MTDETKRRISAAKKGKPSWWKGKARKHGGWLNGKPEPLYGIWASMKLRCSGGVKKAIKHYSAKGIQVCTEWLDYAVFREWALTHGYENRSHLPRGQRLSIDRIDPDGDYEPNNCRFITMAENARLANEARVAREAWMIREIMRLTKRVEELEKVTR